MAWTTPRTWVSGEVLTAALLNTHLRDQLNFLLPAFARKTSDTSRASTTTFADDPHLSVAVEASTVHEVACNFGFQSAGTAGDVKIQFTGPAGATLLAGVHTTQAAGTATTDDLTTSLTLNTLVSAGVAQTAEPWNTIVVIGLLVTAGTAGNFTLQWAQNTSSATATIGKTNSFLSLRRRV